MKRVKRLLVVVTLNIVWGSCWVSSADAGVITFGTRTTTDANAFWNNTLWDGSDLNASDLLASTDVTEYPGADGALVGFAFDQSEYFWQDISDSAWTDGGDIWQLADISVDFGTPGYTYNTLTPPWRLSLFRSLRAMRKEGDDSGSSQPPTPTPEPGTLMLMLCGGVAAFRKMRSRKA